MSRGCWKLAKVISLVSSHDGHKRSAKVRISSGRVLVRPLNLLYPLEISETCENKNEESVTPSENGPLSERPKRSTVEKRCNEYDTVYTHNVQVDSVYMYITMLCVKDVHTGKSRAID